MHSSLITHLAIAPVETPAKKKLLPSIIPHREKTLTTFCEFCCVRVMFLSFSSAAESPPIRKSKGNKIILVYYRKQERGKVISI
jgi:hypothetical protein